MNGLGGFVNAGLLAGAALAAVPLIIHLLNRQRHKPMPWAAMRFVQAAWKKTRRRVEMENLLLLLLRMAVLALLAFAVARPFSGAKSPLAGLTESRRDLVLLVDSSASMGWREGVETSYERALARARELVHQLDAGRGDRVRLLLCAQDPRLVSWTTPEQALSVLDAVSAPADEPLDLARALAEVLRFAKEDAGGAGSSTLEVRLLSDLQRRAFRFDVEAAPKTAAASGPDALAHRRESGAKASPAAAPLAEVLDALAELSVRVLVEDLGPSATEPQNLGIASVQPLAPVYGAGLPCDVGVEVWNHGALAKTGVRVVLEVDGERRPVELVDVPARGHAQALFQIAFKDAGEHVLTARLEGDRLPVDDVRSQVLAVPPPIRVLLVNGAPGGTLEEDAVALLRSVLEPVPGDGAIAAFAPFDLRVEAPDFLASAEFKNTRFDVVWLADVESPPSSAVDPLERAVAQGTGLVISLGPSVNPAAWNTRLFSRDGARLLPAELGAHVAVPSRRENYYRVKEFQADHPVLAFFADERWRPLLTEVPVYEFLETRPIESARVLARFDDERGSPALIERAYTNRGRVVLLTTTISPQWTRLAESPRTLVPFAHELLRYVAIHEEAPRNVAPGTALVAEVATFPRGLELARPDGTRRALDGAPEQKDGRWTLPAIEGGETTHVGVYTIAMEGARPLRFAVQLDPMEGDLQRLAPRELESLHRAFTVIEAGADAKTGDGGLRPERGELWRKVALACLIVLVLETLWAAWLGARRTVRR
ncbi:MAG: BatA domain-containing protein [Planctomycetota bacterium]